MIAQENRMLSVDHLRKTYRIESGPVPAVSGVSFCIEKGRVYTLLGPSGCGKSTILRCVAGLEKPDEGEIRVGDRVVFSSLSGMSLPAHERNVGMVFQSYAIWPHMNVFDNIAFALVYGKKKHSKKEIEDLVEGALKLVHMEGLAKRSAALLSGGQQQRVALARALVYQPDVLLLDEPLSNLDARLRDTVRKEIRGLVKALNLTILFVTHDQIEALSLSDRIAVMQNGRIVQEGSPRDVYLLPHDGFVGNFVGCANQIKGRLVQKSEDGQLGLVDTVVGQVQGMCPEGLFIGENVIFSIRPEIGSLYAHKPDKKINLIEVDIELLTFTGAFTECLLRSGDTCLEMKVVGLDNLKENQNAYLYLPPESCLVLPTEPERQG